MLGRHYLDEPVALELGEELSGVTDAPFPAITVCDSNRQSRSVARAWGVLNPKGTGVSWRRFPWHRRPVAEFWEEAAPRLTSLVQQCNRRECRPTGARGGSTRQGRWTAGRYRRGLCYTFRPSGPLVFNGRRRLALVLHSDPAEHTAHGHSNYLRRPAVDVFVAGDQPPIVDKDFEDAELSPHLSVDVGSVVSARLGASRWHRLPLRRRPCQPGAGHSRPRCLVSCRWEERSRVVGCRPPWSAAPPSLPLCANQTEFLGMLYKDFRVPSDDPCVRRCLMACNSTTYELRVTSLLANRSGLLAVHRAVLELHWPYAIQLNAERPGYSLSDLISDLGGSLSLLLGVSVVSAVQLAELGVRRALGLCLRHYRRRRRRPAVRAADCPLRPGGKAGPGAAHGTSGLPAVSRETQPAPAAAAAVSSRAA
ncbi:uncharacterized protein LOC122385924 [Amphibalanus amphitrite]|uniref:uncharacterized protein LOC122385924 n=1 Tax=Amphibalanus amphitrite TaxID=1232801 RepID=UPI001C91C3D3|nr:uncharacterized protein LOC122385924 [Amphibalanus amphitrite]